MRSHPDGDQGRAVFHKAAVDLRSKGWTVYNPSEKSEETRSEGQSELDYLRKVFALDCSWICRKAQCLAMLPDWELSLGATAEHALGLALGLRIIYLPKPKPTSRMVSTENVDYKI
jgi:hypothetical protein